MERKNVSIETIDYNPGCEFPFTFVNCTNFLLCPLTLLGVSELTFPPGGSPTDEVNL